MLPPLACQSWLNALQYAIAPFAFRHHDGGAMQAIGASAAGHFAGFVFSGQTELEQLGRTLFAFAVVQRQGGDRQLRASAELFDQRFFQRADDQLHAIGLGLAVELVHRGQARAVIELDGWRLLPGLLRLVVSGHEAFAQCFADRRQRAVLRQQQGDLAQGLAGQFLEFGQWQRQLNGGRVLWVLGAPVVDRGLLLFQGAGGFHRQRQAHPAAEVVGGGRLQLIGRQRGDQGPDRFVVFAGGFTFSIGAMKMRSRAAARVWPSASRARA